MTVASLTVPSGQVLHFPHFSSNLNKFFIFFPQIQLLIFVLILALRVAHPGRPWLRYWVETKKTLPCPGHIKPFIFISKNSDEFRTVTTRHCVFHCFLLNTKGIKVSVTNVVGGNLGHRRLLQFSKLNKWGRSPKSMFFYSLFIYLFCLFDHDFKNRFSCTHKACSANGLYKTVYF